MNEISPFRPAHPDTPEEAAARRAEHSRLCVYYSELARLFHALVQVMVENNSTESGAYPVESILLYQDYSAGTAYLAMRERWAVLSK